MMFLVELTHAVKIAPNFFGRNLQNWIYQKLVHDIEGKFLGRYGYVLAITDVVDNRDGQKISLGELEDATGFAVFRIRYQALVYRPFKGEVVDGVVTRVTQHGFFADAGPLTVFVSHHLIPDDMQFKSVPERFVSEVQGETIQKDTKLRLRIIGLKIEASEVTATGSIRDEFLGPI